MKRDCCILKTAIQQHRYPFMFRELQHDPVGVAIYLLLGERSFTLPPLDYGRGE
ncbi:MAG: hypothetical protein OEZ41_05405 [Nitrospirota bacterium]|nr:hypothetical protein [Nitrospirota bacterium]MDH5699382.1 hypothetical protein [Nitrospirota bacterium]